MRPFVAGLATAVVLVAGCSATAPGPGRETRRGTPAPPAPAAAAGTAAAGTAAPGTAAPAAGSPAGPALGGPAAPARAGATRTPCTGSRRAKWVVVRLRDQHLWLCARGRAVRDTAVTTGMAGPDTATPTGHYRIQGLNRNSVLTLNTGQTYPVKYWIPFDAPLFGFHDSPWQHFPYGSPAYRTRGSHGCVHVPLRFIRFLYSWADIGTSVTIRA